MSVVELVPSLTSLEELIVHVTDRDADTLASWPGLARIRKLGLRLDSQPGAIAKILESPHLKNLEELELTALQLDPTPLGGLPALARVHRLSIIVGELPDAGLPGFPSLVSLDLYGKLGPTAARALLDQHPRLGRVHLDDLGSGEARKLIRARFPAVDRPARPEQPD
jgi:hypothetical protein